MENDHWVNQAATLEYHNQSEHYFKWDNQILHVF